MAIELTAPFKPYIGAGGVLTVSTGVPEQGVYWELVSWDPITETEGVAYGSLKYTKTKTDAGGFTTNIYTGPTDSGLVGKVDRVKVKSAAEVLYSFSPSKSPSLSSSLSASKSPSLSPSVSPSITSDSPSIPPESNAGAFAFHFDQTLDDIGGNNIWLDIITFPSTSKSISPSRSSSISRSQSPSRSISPSLSKSLSPSGEAPASYSPSISPSISPSYSPSYSPSRSPSVSPSLSPSLSPSPTSFTWANGISKVNSAVVMDGTFAFVTEDSSLLDPSLIDTGVFYIESVFYLDVDDYGGEEPWIWLLSGDNWWGYVPMPELLLEWDDSLNAYAIRVTIDTAGTNCSIYQDLYTYPEFKILQGQWYHVLIEYDRITHSEAPTVKIYVNGSLWQSESFAGATTLNSGDPNRWLIGFGVESWGGHFKGKVDLSRVFTRYTAWNSEEVADRYAALLAGA